LPTFENLFKWNIHVHSLNTQENDY
jgi:hypothetical protein